MQLILPQPNSQTCTLVLLWTLGLKLHQFLRLSHSLALTVLYLHGSGSAFSSIVVCFNSQSIAACLVSSDDSLHSSDMFRWPSHGKFYRKSTYDSLNGSMNLGCLVILTLTKCLWCNNRTQFTMDHQTQNICHLNTEVKAQNCATSKPNRVNQDAMEKGDDLYPQMPQQNIAPEMSTDKPTGLFLR